MSKRWWAVLIGAFVLAISVVFSNASDEPSGPLERLGVAACRDLDNGLSLFQIASGGLDSGMSRSDIKHSLVLGIEKHCPQYREQFRRSMIWTDW